MFQSHRLETRVIAPRSTAHPRAIAGFIAASAIVPASAATHHKRTAPVQSEYSTEGLQNAQAAAHPGAPAYVLRQPNACFSDEGYGRYSPCDQAGN
jgi:hypothetical protein